MGMWGFDAMDGDGPLDLQSAVANACADRLRKALMHSDDVEVFAAAHIAMDLQEAGVLDFEYAMFERGDKSLEVLIRGSVTNVAIDAGWDGSVHKREEVRRALIIRLDSLKARHRASVEARRNS